jgi:MOSC domain-containing protein YiiM
MGRVEALWIKRAHRGPMDRVDTMQLIERRGIADNADIGGRRQVTILSIERWRDLTAELGDIDPATRRANVLVSGIELDDSRDRRLRIGACELLVNGETRPCRLMDFAVPGLQVALDPKWGGGAYAEVTTGGTVTVGDPVEWITTG